MARRDPGALLAEYRRKRDFSKTSEPDHVESRRSRRGDRSFVIQKHDATRLHYDFRLEWDGVLKSWAVTRGPSEDPAEKRLAVRTEDHPLAYGGFEGVIPKGQYGGGTVMLWDRGTWEPVEDFDAGLKSGKLVFRLDGERLKGEWTLVRMKPKPGEKRENWLLIKHREEGRKPPRGDALKKFVRSVDSDRTMTEIAKGGRTLAESDLAGGGGKTPRRDAGKDAKGGAAGASRARAMPRWREPQLATLVERPPSGDGWLSELKYDGYRALIAVAGGRAKVFTRSGKDWTARFGAIAAAAAALDCQSALIDGEIVAFDGEGRTDFSTLQAELSREKGSLSCFCFDLLERDGQDLREKPLTARKAELEKLLGRGSQPLIYSSHVDGDAPAVFDQVCSAGQEGIVVKRADGPYRSGRGRGWLKVKCTRSQEFVIGGWSPSDKRGRPLASILIGVRDGDRLVYKGRVGSFEAGTLEKLAPLLASRARKTSPFAEVPRDVRRDSRYVRPDLVGEIGFAEFTSDGLVRHGVFKGLREDKKAENVVLETTGDAMMAKNERREAIAGVKLTHPDKVLYPDAGVTKADLAAHYERVAPRMLPFVEKRLLSLVRCPDGISGQCFYQKHESKGFPGALKRMEIEEASGKRDEYLHVADLAGLVAAVQMSTLEFHIWGSRIDLLEKPDRLVFDLDPDEGMDFGMVTDAAADIAGLLEDVGLKSLPMVTGGKGVHVVAPIDRRADWDMVKGFARGFAKSVAADRPDRFLAEASKEKRKGRIFIDWLRNERGSTAIAPYSTRAKKGAPVATPVSWDELTSLRAANSFHIADMERRLAMADPWKGAEGWKQSMTRSMLAKVQAS